MRNIDEQNDHLKAACQRAVDQLNAHAAVGGRNSRPSSYIAAVSASRDACVQSTDDQSSD